MSWSGAILFVRFFFIKYYTFMPVLLLSYYFSMLMLILSYYEVPWYIISYRIISYHISYHIISHQQPAAMRRVLCTCPYGYRTRRNGRRGLRIPYIYMYGLYYGSKKTVVGRTRRVALLDTLRSTRYEILQYQVQNTGQGWRSFFESCSDFRGRPVAASLRPATVL